MMARQIAARDRLCAGAACPMRRSRRAVRPFLRPLTPAVPLACRSRCALPAARRLVMVTRSQ
jgi:hypothetical protein